MSSYYLYKKDKADLFHRALFQVSYVSGCEHDINKWKIKILDILRNGVYDLTAIIAPHVVLHSEMQHCIFYTEIFFYICVLKILTLFMK